MGLYGWGTGGGGGRAAPVTVRRELRCGEKPVGDILGRGWKTWPLFYFDVKFGWDEPVGGMEGRGGPILICCRRQLFLSASDLCVPQRQEKKRGEM